MRISLIRLATVAKVVHEAGSAWTEARLSLNLDIIFNIHRPLATSMRCEGECEGDVRSLGIAASGFDSSHNELQEDISCTKAPHFACRRVMKCAFGETGRQWGDVDDGPHCGYVIARLT